MNDYKCDLYEHQSYYYGNCPVVDDDCLSQCSDNSLDLYYLIHHGNTDDQDTPPENESPQSDAPNRFQVMLHDLIMTRKASLQMFDDICNLVNDYTSSQELANHTKLPSQKSFFHHMEQSHCTHLVHPTNCNVNLHYGTTGPVSVSDLKKMLLNILTDASFI